MFGLYDLNNGLLEKFETEKEAEELMTKRALESADKFYVIEEIRDEQN